MLTIPAATRLLADASDLAGLVRIGHACGFEGDPAPLDARARASIGIPPFVSAAHVLAGRGTLRALCAEFAPHTLTRDSVAKLTITLQQKSPFAYWLVLGSERHGTHACAATAIIAPRKRASMLVVDRRKIVDSDADTMRAIAAAGDGLDLLVHSRWCEILGREALTQRFFRALEHSVEAMAHSLSARAPESDARTLALLTATRLLFLSFLEAKGWLDGDHGFIRRTWDASMAGRGHFHRNVLLPLCFGTLNTPRSRRAEAARAFGQIPFLNGGLFTRTPLERAHRHALFADDTLGVLVCDLLGRWRFTVREAHAAQSEAAVDPEMLGRAFESLMASRERRASGSFYTPRVLVERVFDAGLAATVANTRMASQLERLRTTGFAPPADAMEIGAHLSRIRVLDPACGSGAFLVHALDTLAHLRARCAGGAVDGSALRREILARQIFGVDREPMAVWLCELRLWLAVVVETPVSDPHAVPPLPNLDAQIRAGDALAGDAFIALNTPSRLGALRVRYARATGARKRTLSRALATEERRAAAAASDARMASIAARRRDVLTALRGRDLFGRRNVAGASARGHLDELRRTARELRDQRRALARGAAVAFDFAAQFADVGAQGGFDLVVGNPPWVRLHRIPARERARLRAHFVAYREAGWRSGAAVAGVASGFAAQVDLAALFVERSLALTRERGAVSLLVPTKLWRSLAGGGVRRMLLRASQIVELEDWSEARATFDAAVYPSLVVATRHTPDAVGQLRMTEHHRDTALTWDVPTRALPFDDTPGAPWVLIPGAPRAGFDALREMGTPLAAQERFRPRLGVKCGCNEAFIVSRGDDGAISSRDGRRGRIEPSMLRPLLRGEAVTQWRIPAPRESIVFPHDARLDVLRQIPPLTCAWLSPWKQRLRARTDLAGRKEWWSLFRTDAANSRTPRLVWADLSRAPRVAVIPPGDPTVPLNTCYVLFPDSMEEAWALAAWLNSPLAAAWLAALAEPARGGFRRMFGWTVGLMPIPRDWDAAIERLAPIGRRGADGTSIDTAALLDDALAAIGIAPSVVEGLLTWGHR